MLLAPVQFVTDYRPDKDSTAQKLKKMAKMANKMANKMQPRIIPLDKANTATLERLQLAIEDDKYGIRKTPHDYDKTDLQDLGILSSKGEPPNTSSPLQAISMGRVAT